MRAQFEEELMAEDFRKSMRELEWFVRGRESAKEEGTAAMAKSRPGADFLAGGKEGDSPEKEIALLHRGLEEIKQANLSGKLSDQAYGHLRRMALARLEQLNAGETEAAMVTKSIAADLRFGTVAPSMGAQYFLIAGNLAGKVGADYFHDWMSIGR